MSEDFLLNDLMADVEAALDASEQLQRYTNYGKLGLAVEYIHWDNRQKKMVDSATYRSLPANQKQMDIIITVDIQEFKSELDFGYSRKVKFCGKDWYDIVEPSLVAVFSLEGKGRELTAAAVKKLFESKNKYVFIDDVPNKGGKTYNDKVLKVPMFTSVFASREELAQAVNERFGGFPSDMITETTSTTATPDYSSDVVSAVKLMAKGGKTIAQLCVDFGLTESDVKNILEM